MHRILPFFILLFAFAFLAAHSAQALSVPTPLIKGASNAAVYYLAGNGKRYVFPTEKTFRSWYSSFDHVRTVSDAELASYQIGGNVTYRPAARLVKVTTDPRVYAISIPNTLRWVESESVAKSLFGDTWNRNIDDIPDAFFVNYRIGTSIKQLSDYNQKAESDNAPTFDSLLPSDLGTAPAVPPILPLPAAPHLTTIASSKQTVSHGDTTTLTTTASPMTGVTEVRIYFNNILQTTCQQASCATDVLIPFSLADGPYEIRSEVQWIYGRVATSTQTININQATNSQITLQLTNDEVKPGRDREIIVRAEGTVFASLINIFLDGQLFKICSDTQECRSISVETGSIGTTHSVHAVIRDSRGVEHRTATKTLSVVANERPAITILIGKDKIFKGETVDITANASDDDGVSSLEILYDGGVLKTCLSSTCNLVTGPWNTAGSLNFTVRAKDSQGAVTEKTSTSVVVE